ncbi:ribonuclease P protein component [Filibacter tadaridae]|uniref:Ribonuclease P protein component n=1 Tax=Filibacter tadaridae TaxID=2483811 RepID=A0A3P5WJ44_9BACL|nr:ribonuclease P protein component [Filibacter tadaridae]VDC21708.1 Ribonuclease P protein component [Filibacter tadaridae]
MNKRQRVKKDKEFQQVFKTGKSIANRQFVVYSLRKEGQIEFRIGLSVSKKVGNAVTRNRIKRYIRQSFLEMKEEVQDNMDYVIIARHQAAKLDFHETKKSLQHVLRIAKVLKREKK